jgi:hypothetical protein
MCAWIGAIADPLDVITPTAAAVIVAPCKENKPKVCRCL